MNGPKLTSILNGFFSLVELGLTNCYGGFGDLTTKRCERLLDGREDPDEYSRGELNYTPQRADSSPSAIVDDLALVLTGGRLHSGAKAILMDAYSNNGGFDTVQKLMTTVPEFHSTGLVESRPDTRPDFEIPDASGRPYKAIVFLMLDGGADSYNMLVPHSGCVGKGMPISIFNNEKL